MHKTNKKKRGWNGEAWIKHSPQFVCASSQQHHSAEESKDRKIDGEYYVLSKKT